MAKPRPKTSADYIDAAPPEAQPHLRKLHAILKKAAPKATEAIKWGNPFFVDPRFVYAFSAHKAHCSFAPTAGVLAHFAKDLAGHATTQHFLKLPYAKPFPEKLVRDMAKYRVAHMGEGEGFWDA